MGSFRHDARRDTLWVGKGLRGGWLTAAGVVAGAILLALLMHG